MKPDAEKEVYYTSGGEQFGPVTLDRLKALCSAGEIDRAADFVWWEGLSDWVPAGQVEGLFPAQRPTGGAGAADIPRRPKRASFGLVLTLEIVAFVISFLGGLLLGIGAAENEDALLGTGVVLIIIGFLVAVVGGIFGLIYLYRAWLIVQGSTARTTPGKAVGFLFIPLFNLYWQFQAVYGWAKDYNAFREDYALTAAPRMPAGLFLAVPIFNLLNILPIPVLSTIVSLVVLILSLVMIYHLCKAVNHFAVES